MSKDVRWCACGQVSGHYRDNKRVLIYKGDRDTVIPIGISNASLLDALKEQPEFDGERGGLPIEAFLIPRNCATVEYYTEIEEPDEDD
ncbi:MAG: hypothetical protein ACXABY_15915 [Candidatus Thorarchaeota archaeon]|jgi:hypothetical protein